ncbi:MAG: SMI1/KNR4 family protein [Phycisphaerales bacterium]|nr:SMI1/KNR4 family protein [Phycisphaerales bacterium]
MFERLGFPLSADCAMDMLELKTAEKRLGVRFPAVLRDYYLVAGNERAFNHIHDHLRPPSECKGSNRRGPSRGARLLVS